MDAICKKAFFLDIAADKYIWLIKAGEGRRYLDDGDNGKCGADVGGGRRLAVAFFAEGIH